jgi:O-antigen/teichoic acid export membrane protein
MLPKILKRSLFLKNTATLVSGTALAQLIGVLLTPVLSRYFTPAEFGILGSVTTIAMIVASTATFRYEMGIVISRHKKETNSLIQLSFTLLLIISPIFLLAIQTEVFSSLLGIGDYSSGLKIIIVILIIFLGLRSILREWLNKLGEFVYLTKRIVLERLITLAIQLALGIFFGYSLGLVIGNVGGVIAGILLMLMPALKYFHEMSFSWKHLKLTAKKYYRFALYSTPQNLLNTVSQGLPILMLGIYFDKIEIGAYFFAMRLLQLPSALISESIKRTFYKEAADNVSKLVKLRNKYFKLTGALGLVIVIPVVIIFFYGPELFTLFFGEEWYSSGVYAGWMFLWVGTMFMNPPSAVMYNVFNKQHVLLIFEVLLFALRFGSLYYFGKIGDILLTIQAYSIVGVLFNFIFIGYISYLFIYGVSNRR